MYHQMEESDRHPTDNSDVIILEKLENRSSTASDRIHDEVQAMDSGEVRESQVGSIKDEEDINDDKDKQLSHQEAMEQFKDALAEIIVGDPLLMDLHTEVTLDEVNSHIALEHGQAMTVNVRRADDTVLHVTVIQNATVHELKKAIQRHFVLRQERQNGTKHISWRYIWKRHWLYYNGQKLTDDRQPIRDLDSLGVDVDADLHINELFDPVTLDSELDYGDEKYENHKIPLIGTSELKFMCVKL